MKFLVLLIIAFTSLQHPTFAKPNLNLKDDPNVVVSLYYESLCPYCKSWVTDSLIPTYEKLGKYMTVEMIPYGNAHQEPNGDSWDFTCQHGPTECKGNIQQACVLKYVPDQDQFIYTIHCIEESGDVTSEDAISECLKEHADATAEMVDTIMSCSNNDEGNQLHHEMGVKTDNLKPRHTYVPWVTFNHEHSEDDTTEDCQFDLLNCLCRDYLKDVPECKTNVKKNVCPKHW